MYNISSLEIEQNTIGCIFILVFNIIANWNNLKTTKQGKIINYIPEKFCILHDLEKVPSQKFVKRLIK